MVLGKQHSRLYTSRCYGSNTRWINIFMFKKHLSRCKLFLISFYMTVCACIINITSYSAVDGLLQNSVWDCTQAVAMATKHVISRVGRLHMTSHISRQIKWLTINSNLCWKDVRRISTFGFILTSNEKSIKKLEWIIARALPGNK